MGIEKPALGDYVNDWNIPVNNDWTIIDQAAGSPATYTFTGGTQTLTIAQSAFNRIFISGSLTNNLFVQFPAAMGGVRYLYNGCTLNGYTVTVQSGASDVTGGVIIPGSLFCPIIFHGGGTYYDDYQSVPPGTVHCFAGTIVPPGFVFCDGSGYSTTNYQRLFNAIGYTYGGSSGTFLVPDTRGRILAGADNMGGTAANRLTGYSISVAGGEATHTLVSGEMPTHNHPVTDPGHAHGVTDPGHVHGIVTNNSGSSGSTTILNTTFTSGTSTINTNSATTGISINSNTTGITTQNTGGGGAHNNVQPTIAINHIIRF